ncbi:MAG: hypothetical protein [Microviridae sp.]|nr:MAG: hypothetical protein [Microviridae sp.]
MRESDSSRSRYRRYPPRITPRFRLCVFLAPLLNCRADRRLFCRNRRMLLPPLELETYYVRYTDLKSVGTVVPRRRQCPIWPLRGPSGLRPSRLRRGSLRGVYFHRNWPLEAVS